jgi:hypothetical protein
MRGENWYLFFWLILSITIICFVGLYIGVGCYVSYFNTLCFQMPFICSKRNMPVVWKDRGSDKHFIVYWDIFFNIPINVLFI